MSAGLYARLEARRDAEVFPAIHGVTGGLEDVAGAFLAVGGASPMMSLGNALLPLLAGSIDAPESMAAGSMVSLDVPVCGVVCSQRWVLR